MVREGHARCPRGGDLLRPLPEHGRQVHARAARPAEKGPAHGLTREKGIAAKPGTGQHRRPGAQKPGQPRPARPQIVKLGRSLHHGRGDGNHGRGSAVGQEPGQCPRMGKGFAAAGKAAPGCGRFIKVRPTGPATPPASSSARRTLACAWKNAARQALTRWAPRNTTQVHLWGSSSAGRASPSQGGGRGFKSLLLHQEFQGVRARIFCSDPFLVIRRRASWH